MSSVRAVRVAESRVVCAERVEMWDWVCAAMVVRDCVAGEGWGVVELGLAGGGEGRWVFR